MSKTNRRRWMTWAAGTAVAAGTLPARAAQQLASRTYAPRPGAWRTFEVTTTVEIAEPNGATRVWVPLPAVDSDWQRSLGHQWSGNARSMKTASDPAWGASMLVAEFDAAQTAPRVVVTSKVRTRDRAVDWSEPRRASEDAATLRRWTAPTELMPTDGIVRTTALEAVGDARSDEQKVRRLYDWVVSRTYREPKVRGCGVGDIRTMLETQDFGGKCGDINGLFVGLCRAVGVPARDVYGLRIAPSAFGYKELGGNPAKLQGAQHCRAEVFLQRYGWVAMDPADVGKVMRLETPEWIRTTDHPVVAPVNAALFGGWEGNWLAYNTAHDVVLPGATLGKLGFFMYPQAENGNGRYDTLDPERFRYTITSKEVTV